MAGFTVAALMTPTNLLADAKELSSVLLKPARQRTVISRAYYASYHAAAEGFAPIHASIAGGGMHRQFIRALRGSADTKTKAVGMRLDGLYSKRILADYQLGGMVTAQMALEAVEDAEEIVFDLIGLAPL
jgi:uncharacterized protein (UPF0332 family)